VKKIVWFITLAIILTAVSSVGLAAQPGRDPVAMANDFLDQMEKAYDTKNYAVITSFYENPVVEVDVTRKIHQFLKAESFQTELKKSLEPLTGISLKFTEREISSEKDLILVHTLRIGSANEMTVVVKVELLMVLKHSSSPKSSSNYVITDQILLSEEYIPVTKPQESGPGSETKQSK
jgi:hypothetical protein